MSFIPERVQGSNLNGEHVFGTDTRKITQEHYLSTEVQAADARRIIQLFFDFLRIWPEIIKENVF